MTSDGLQQAKDLMAEGGVHPRAIAVFAHSYGMLASGETGLMAESDLEPVAELPRLADLATDPGGGRAAMAATAVVKLNGGLGTSMGMDKAKSLLEVRPGKSFLDIIAEQILALRAEYGVGLPVVFMDSFRTSRRHAQGAGRASRAWRSTGCRWTSCRTASPSCARTT